MSDMKRLLSGAYMLGYIDARNDKAIDPIGAIERLTMNLNKSDLISRQDAIEHFKAEEKVYGNGAFTLEEIEHELSRMPSAEHHKLNIAEYIHDQYPDVWRHAEKELEVPSADASLTQDRCKIDSDFINRAEAIKIVQTHPVVEALGKLTELPPAEPEIIRCKDCKHFEYDHPYIIQGIPVLGHEVCNAWGDGCKTDENGYCFMAERRTDE